MFILNNIQTAQGGYAVIAFGFDVSRIPKWAEFGRLFKG